MSKWEEPRLQLLKYSEPSATGRDLGVIGQKYFESGTWEPLLTTEVGRGQYTRFVASMIERIRLKESSYDEIRSFVHLVATEHNWDFMKVAMPYLPELKEQYPHDTKNFEIALLFLLKPKIRRRGIKETQNAIPVAKTYEKGLPETEEQLLRRSLFGPSLGAVDSPGMNRLFKSTLELAYPQRALDRSMRKAKDQGTDIEHCFEGLPRNMPIRDANTRSDKSSSSHRNRMAFTTGISIANTSADRSRVSSLSSMEGNEPNDRPPHELLTLAVDVVDPPVPNIPPKTKTFHGELPKLSGIGDIDAVLARRGESPDRPQVPCDRPSRVQHGPTERDAVSGHHKQPASVSLKYLHILERMSTPQKPDPGTRWPGSAEDVSSGPIAASPKPIETDMNPVTMPKCS